MVKKIVIAVVCSLALIGSARAAKVWLLGNGGAGTPLGVSGGGSGGGAGNDLWDEYEEHNDPHDSMESR